MTVAIYEGANAEENWREAISRHSSFRHPSIIQLFGTARASSLWAAIFHDELVHAQQMLEEKYSLSPISTIYFLHFLDSQFNDVAQYLRSVSGKSPDPEDCTLWIRPSTGSLCVDLSPDDFSVGILAEQEISALFPPKSLLEPNQDTKIIVSMSLSGYHRLCCFYLSECRSISISTQSTVKLGTVNRLLGLGFESSMEIASHPDCPVSHFGWNDIRAGLRLANGWTRITSAEVDATYNLSIYCFLSEDWLSQANHIFKCSDITSNFEDYAWVDCVSYELKLSGPIDTLPSAYLFLCPLASFRSEDPSRFRYPECPGYWSLDPSGDERLEDAQNFGFPSMELKMTARLWLWDANTYAGLREFHEVKGFDPYSQDVARHLGLRLFQLSDEPYFADTVDSDTEADQSVPDELSSHTFRHLQLRVLTSTMLVANIQWIALLLFALAVVLKSAF